MFLQGQHVLSVEQFSVEQIRELFDTAEKLEAVASGKVTTRLLNGAILANLFFEASTRTRMSFHAAFARLGGDVSDTTGFSFSSISKGESLADTARVIAEYADVVVMRHPEQGSVAEFAQYSKTPVINGGDGAGEHPTQALLDLYTIRREYHKTGRKVGGTTIAMTGDLKHGRTVHSLAKLLCLFDNMTFHFVAPKALSMPSDIIDKLQTAGHTVKTFTDPVEGIQHADVIYCTRIQQERIAESELEGHDDLFNIDNALIEPYANSDAIILHPLPRDARVGAFDLATDVDDDPRLKIFTQAANGIPVRMALFVHCLGLEKAVGNDFQPALWADVKA